MPLALVSIHPTFWVRPVFSVVIRRASMHSWASASVCPPDGEYLDAAAERLQEALERIARKHKGGAVAVVLGPIALALTRCHLERAKPKEFHQMKSGEPVWYRMVDEWFEPSPTPASR